jgi:hypothetical protein
MTVDTTSYEAARWVYLPLASYGWSIREPLPRRPAPSVAGCSYVVTDIDDARAHLLASRSVRLLE